MELIYAGCAYTHAYLARVRGLCVLCVLNSVEQIVVDKVPPCPDFRPVPCMCWSRHLPAVAVGSLGNLEVKTRQQGVRETKCTP